MNDILAMIIAAIIAVTGGLFVGMSLHLDIVNSDCAKYGKFATDKYVMTCEER